MTRSLQLSKTFRSIKSNHQNNITPPPKPISNLSIPSSSSSWKVYLILSTNPPIKTYVGVTTNFSRRLKQHNGEIKGGAKASRSGRPWVCACIIRGFRDRSEACELESKWKSISKKSTRKRRDPDKTEKSSLLLEHRQVSLNKVKNSLDFKHLEIDWKINTT